MNKRLTKFEIIMLLLAASLCFSAVADADNRHDSHVLIKRLYRAGVEQRMPDELKSAAATLAAGDDFFVANQRDLAERFYLLAMQKSRIIMAALPGALPELSPEEHTQLSNQLFSPPAASVVPAAVPAPPVPEQSLLPAVQVVPLTSKLPAAEPEQALQEPDQVFVKEDELSAPPLVSNKIIGSVSVYTVVKGDTLGLVTARLGVTREQLVRENKLAGPRAPLKVGQKLRYNNRKIIPRRAKNGIIINVPDKTLYFFKQGKLAISLPVALGVPVTNEKYDWKTPLGKFKITAKVKDPTWYVPSSIQSEMEEKGKDVITSVPPGPDNPLGKFAMKTSLPGILIHSTTKPWSIYGYASHGCIRVSPEQMEELFNSVTVNTPGEIIYHPVKVVETESGMVLLEAHNDVYGMYGKNTNLAREVRALIEKKRLSDRVDWQRVEAVIRQKAGVAENITLIR